MWGVSANFASSPMNCAIPPGQSRVMDNNHQTAQPETKAPVQLQLAGLETTPVGIDPRFILSDEVCRNGLRHIADIRRYFAEKRQVQAA